MSSITNPRRFLFQFQRHSNYRQEKGKIKIPIAIARKIRLALWHMLSKEEEDFIDIYLKRPEELERTEEQISLFESCMANYPFDIPFGAMQLSLWCTVVRFANLRIHHKKRTPRHKLTKLAEESNILISGIRDSDRYGFNRRVLRCPKQPDWRDYWNGI